MNKLLYLTLPAIMACSAGLRAQEIAPADSSLVYRLTLEECLDFAMGNSYDRQSILLAVESRELDYLQARRERLPSVSGSVSENLAHTKGNEAVWSGSYGLSTSLTLFQGGSLTNTIEQNRLISEQSLYNARRFDNELTIQILSSFLSILGNDELLKYQRAVLVASEEQRNQGQALFEAGSILESDYLLLESQYASDLTNIVETQISRATNLLALKNLLSLDPTAPLDVIFSDTAELVDVYIPDEEFVLTRAMETLPDLIISGYNVEIAKMDVKLAKANLSPTVSLGAGLGTGHTDFSRYGSQLNNRLNEQVGISVSIPIFNRSRTRTQVKQAQINLRQTELDDRQNVLDVRQTVMSEYQTVLSAAARYQASDIKQNAYLRSFEAYRVQFNFGAITTVDLLQQQNNYISAINEYIQNKYSYIFRRKVLDVYMGYPVTM
ncbi:MAG: TolC family protein [Alistipes sp.]|nr:TolC family protein [Alistipes sp.]